MNSDDPDWAASCAPSPTSSDGGTYTSKSGGAAGDSAAGDSLGSTAAGDAAAARGRPRPPHFLGFSGADALHIYRVLFGYLHGHILTELQEVIERPEETDDVLRLGLHRLAVTEFPQVRALASVLASYDGAAELDRGLDLLFFGLTATLTPPDGSPRAR